MNNFLTALRAAASAGAAMATGWAPDSMIMAGVGLVSYGAWLVYEPAGFITGGVLLLIGGIKAARN